MDVIEARFAYEYMEEKETSISKDEYIKQAIDEEKKQKTQDKIDKIEKMLQQLIHKKSKKHKKKSEN